jgi:hypothetical protein
LELIINNTKLDFNKIIINKLNDNSNKYLISEEFTSENINNYIKKNLKYQYEIIYENNIDIISY